MESYQNYLKCKYDTLELTSPDEMLDCYSPQYIDLILIKDNKRKAIRQSRQSFEVGVKQESDLEYITLSEALDVEGVKKKIVLIKGGPGMGKTSLAINICKCWAKGELLQSYIAVILLTLRDPEIQKAKTIGDLLLTRDDDLRDNVCKEILKEYGNRICFIFEGFDELPDDLHTSHLFSKLTDDLPKCMVIYTSRPESGVFWLHNKISVIEIKGFSKESVNQYILKAFEGEEDKHAMALSLVKQIDSNPEIKSMLHVPINVAIVCLIFYHFSKLPDKLTELYTLLCLRLIFRHIVKRTPNEQSVKALHSLSDLPEEVSKEFSQLCFIAFKGIRNDKIIFSSKDLLDMNVVEDKISGLGLLLVAPSTSVYGREKSYNFLHNTLQEFCAAWYISTLPTVEQSQHFSSYLDFKFDSRYYDFSGIKSDIFWKFYSGITQLSNINVDDIISQEQVKSSFVQHKIHMLIKLLYETNNKSLYQTVGDHLHGVIDYSDVFNNLDNHLRSLSHFLRCYKGKLTFISFRFDHSYGSEGRASDDEIFKLIVKSLKERLLLNETNLVIRGEFPHISVQSFLTFANLLAVDQYPVAKLCLSHLRREHLQLLSQILCFSKTLKVLNIEYGDLGYEEVDFVPNSLCRKILKAMNIKYGNLECKELDYLTNCNNLHLHELGLGHCQLGSSGADKIGIMLSHNSSILSVDLSRNGIDDSGVERLVYHLKDNKTLQCLDLSGNKITPLGALHLREIVNKLDCIKLSPNTSLGHVGIYLILEELTVFMQHIDLCGRDASYCFKSISAILHRVKSINFTVPDDYEDCKIICDSLINSTGLEELEISGISNSNHLKLLNAIGQNSNIKILQINYGIFSDEYAAELAKFIKTNKSLSQLLVSTSRKLSPEGFLLIADSLSENNSIICINISTDYYNKIHPEFVLEFLYQLKQADTLKWLTLFISISFVFNKSCNRIKFHQEVIALIQQINYARSIKGIDPLELDIFDY